MKEVYTRRGSGRAISAVFCRLDIHREITYAAVLDSMGQVAAQRRMRNEEIPEFLGPLSVDRMGHGGFHPHHPQVLEADERRYDVTVSHLNKVYHPVRCRRMTDAYGL